MKKSTRILCTVLALAVMSAFLTACNNEHDDRVEPSIRETETNPTGSIDEPQQSIADSVATTESESSETATTAPSNTGAYTYEAYGYQFSMDVNIDDYLFTSAADGTVCFDLYGLAEAYGWTPHRADGNTAYDSNNAHTVMWYEYSCGDGKYMGLMCGCTGSTSNPTGRQQLTTITYNFILAGNSPLGGNCYEDGSSNPLHGASFISMFNHPSSGDWYGLYGGGQSSASITREDAIILAYLISVGPQHVGENPLYYTDFYNADFRTGESYTLPY